VGQSDTCATAFAVSDAIATGETSLSALVLEDDLVKLLNVSFRFRFLVLLISVFGANGRFGEDAGRFVLISVFGFVNFCGWCEWCRF